LFERLQLLPVLLLLGIMCVMVASAAALVLSEISSRRAIDQAALLMQQLDEREASAELRQLIVDAEMGRRGFLLTHDVSGLQAIETADRRFNSVFDHLKVLSADNKNSTALETLHEVALRQLTNIHDSIQRARAGAFEEAMEISRQAVDTHLMDQFNQQLAAIHARTEAELRTLRSIHSSATFWPRFATLALTVLVFGLLIAVMRLMIDEVIWQREFASTKADEARRLQELVTTRTAELSDLAAHLQTASEREKAELARNLHDELGGLLTAARMDISWLQGATKGMDAQISARLAELNLVFTQAMDVKRRTVETLRPALLDHFGLPTALQSHFDETCRNAGLGCKTSIPDTIMELSKDLAIALFRVAQESLANIVRYARASNVEMSIELVEDMIVLIVKDDGANSDLGASQATISRGITGMRHRIQALKGSFDIRPRTDGGTELKITVPIDQAPCPDLPADPPD
jgi:signal transduction histidine kinase